MLVFNKKYNEIRRRVETFTKDPVQQELLIKLINDNPELEDLLLKTITDNIDNDYFSGAPSNASSSPASIMKTNIPSSYLSGSPSSRSSSPIGSGYPNRSSGCFIATAAFGSPLEENVLILKSFRDQYLQKTIAGRLFVKYYYRFSPKISIYISEKSFLKKFVRTLLMPLIWICKKINY